MKPLLRSASALLTIAVVFACISAAIGQAPGGGGGDPVKLYDERPKTKEFMEDGGAGPMKDVKTRIKNQIDKPPDSAAQPYQEHEPAVKSFLERIRDAEVLENEPDDDIMNALDRGYDSPLDFHRLDKEVIDNHWEECLDLMRYQNMSCMCYNPVDLGSEEYFLPGIPSFEPMSEYWFPVSKVETVATTLTTGYVNKTTVGQKKSDLDRLFPSPYDRWVSTITRRFGTVATKYINDNFPAVLEITPIPEMRIESDRVDVARSGPDKQDDRDVNYRTQFEDRGSYSYVEWHVLPEPHGRNELYWKYKEICHWNLDYREVGQRGNSGTTPSDGSDIPVQNTYYGDFPDAETIVCNPTNNPCPPAGPGRPISVKQFSVTRNWAEMNYQMFGKDQLRAPFQVEYDHLGSDAGAGGGGSEQVYDAVVDNGGTISKYMTQQDDNPLICTENYMDRYKFVTLDKGRTPEDMLKPLWEKEESTDEDFYPKFLATGCMRKNLGAWVPTRNSAMGTYHTQAAMIGSMKGLKMAYYYFASDTTSEEQGAGPKGRGCKSARRGGGLVQGMNIRFRDSYGLKPCYYREWRVLPNGLIVIHAHVPDGIYYDFEPDPYTFAGMPHRTLNTDEETYWITRCKGGGICISAADKVQWSMSPEMPKKCMGLPKYFNELEKNFEGNQPIIASGGPQGAGDSQTWDGQGYPNRIELPDSNASSRWPSGNLRGKRTDVQNVAIEWRFFRSCPKEKTMQGNFLKIKGTNTAMCCQPCPCPPFEIPDCPASACVPEKLL